MSNRQSPVCNRLVTMASSPEVEVTESMAEVGEDACASSAQDEGANEGDMFEKTGYVSSDAHVE